MLPIQTREILQSLSAKDIQKLGNFIKSPYFNTNPTIEKIFRLIKKHHPDFNKSVFRLDEVFRKLYPGNVYREQTIRNLYSEFSALIRKFIGIEELQSAGNELDAYIAGGLTRKGLYGISEKFIKKSLGESNDEFLTGNENFFYLYSINNVSIDNRGYLQEHRSEGRLNAMLAALEKVTVFFLSESMNLSVEIFDIYIYTPEDRKDTIIDEFYKSLDMKKFISYLENSGNKYASFIKIRYYLYYYYINFLTEQDYPELKSEILKTIHLVKKSEQLSFITVTVHLIVSKLIPYNREFLKEVFDFALLFQSLNIFPDKSNVRISLGLFKNFFTVALILKEYDWLENFVNEYSLYLSDEFRENEVNYSLGILSFKRGHYEKSLDYLNKFKMKDVSEKINTRFYIMMNYLELKAYESALSVLQTLRQFYIDREIPEVYSTLMEGSIKFFNEIIKNEEAGKKIDTAVYMEAKNISRYYHKQYILEKMETLI